MLGIFSAAELPYFWEIWGPIVALRLSTSPFVMILPIWLVKELIKRDMSITCWLLLSEFCWVAWSVTLSYYLLFWWVVQAPQVPLEYGIIAPIVLAVLLTGVVWYAYWKRYKTVASYYKSHLWLFIKLILVFVTLFSITLLFLNVPTPTANNSISTAANPTN